MGGRICYLGIIFFFPLCVFAWYILLWACRGSVTKYKSTVLLARNFFLVSKFTLEYVSGPTAAHCFGFFLHLFPFLRNQWSKRKGSTVQCGMFLSSLMLDRICLYYLFGHSILMLLGMAILVCVQTANLETCICKQRYWKHNISIILLSQLYQKGQDRFPRY